MSTPNVMQAKARVDELTTKYNDLVAQHNDLIAIESPTAGQVTRSADISRAMGKAMTELDDATELYRSILQTGIENGTVATEGSITGPGPVESFNINRGQAVTIDRSAVWDADTTNDGPATMVYRAHRALDVTHKRGLERMTESSFEAVEQMLTEGTQTDINRAARWAVAASDPAYESAFAKLVMDPQRGHLEWDATELRAYQNVTNVARAMSLTDGNGGYMVPFTLDPAIMLTNDGSNNPLRQLATIKRITTDTWNGVTSAGATAEWKSEAAEVADGSPTIAQPSIPTFFGDSFVPYSYEWGMDADDALSELTKVLVDAADNLMAAAYTTGNGSSAPQGIVTGLVGGSSEINTTGSETYDDSDPFVLQNALPARFSANATFQAHIATMNAYRQMETANGALLFPELRQNPPYLLGKRFFENSNMDGAINAAATANNYVMVYGDVRAGFVIVDRIGTTIELIPNLMGDNNRPTGQRGALLWFRTGSEVVVPQALRLLDVPTAA